MIKNIVKTSMISGLLLSSLPAIAAEGGNGGGNSNGDNKYDAKKAILMEKIERAHGLPKDIAGEVNKTGVELEHFAFTCPTVDLLMTSTRDTSPYPPQKIEHMGVIFTTNQKSVVSSISFHGTSIRGNDIQCIYDLNKPRGSMVGVMLIYHAELDKKCHASAGAAIKQGKDGDETFYFSDNPEDIKIICEK